MRLYSAEEILQALHDGLEVSCVYEGLGRRYFRLEEGSPVILVFCGFGTRCNRIKADAYTLGIEMKLYSKFEAHTCSNLPFKELPV